MSTRRNSKFLTIFPACLAAAAFLILCILLRVRPDRLIGAAFCHQAETRSPEFGFPFCYRCSGLFFGLFWGMLYTFLIRKTDRLFSLSTVIPLIVSIILFLTDIINTTKYIPIRFYQERITIRFLSSYPLGFYLAKTATTAFGVIFGAEKTSRTSEIVYTGIILCISCLISYLVIFSRNLPVMRIFGFLISAGSLVFLSLLYTILIRAAATLRGKTLSLRNCAAISVFFALCQICIMGSLHIYLFPFDQLF